MKKRQRLYILIVLIILSSDIIFAPKEYNPRDYDNPNDYFSEEGASYSEFTQGGGSISDISAGTLSNNPGLFNEIGSAGDIGQLRPEQIGDNINQISSEYRNQLTTSQLTYNNNINQIPDWNNLNQQARDQAISQLTGASVTTNTANQPTSGQITDDGFTFDQIAGLQIDGSTLTNAEGVTYISSASTLTAEHADSYVDGGSITTNIDNLNAQEQQFSVESADSVLIGCLTVNNIRETTFRKTGGKVEMQPAQGVVLDIEDCNYAETTFTAIGDNSKLVIEGDKYSITNGSVEFEGVYYNETVEVNNTATLTIDPAFGFKCTNITAIGSYFYDAGNITANFGFKVFDYSFRLCIRKDVAQAFDLCPQCGIIDIVDKKISLEGAGFSYLRYSVLFHESGFSLVFPLLKPMYESTDLGNKMEMLFDNEMLIGSLSLENFNAGENNISVSAGGSHRIIEIPGTRLLQIIRKQITSFVQLYKTSFIGLEPDITVDENGTLVQHGKNAVKAFAPESKELKEFEKSLEIEDFGDFRKP